MRKIRFFILLLFIIYPKLFAQDFPDIGTYFQHGPYKQILNAKNYGYFLTNRGVDIYNISDRSALSLVSTINTRGNAMLIELKNYLFFVMDSADGILIYDVSNPSSPDSLANIPEVTDAKKIIYHDNKLYAFYDTHVKIYSLVDVTNPVLFKDFTYTSNKIGTFVFNDAYVNSHFLIIGFSLGRVIYDMENDFSIINDVTVEFTSVTGQNMLFESILGSYDKFTYFDLSPIYSTGNVYMPNEANNTSSFLYKNLFASKGLFHQSANYMLYNPYLIDNTPGDVKDINTLDTILCLAKKDTFLFTGGYRGDTNQVKVYRFSKNRTTSFQLIDSISTSKRLLDAVNNDDILVFLTANSLEFYNIENPESVSLIKSLSLPGGSGSEIALKDSLLYIALGSGGLYKLNISNVSSLSSSSFVQISSNNISRVYINDIYLIFYDKTNSGFYFYKKSGSQYSDLAASYNYSGEVYSIAASYQKMYFSTGDKIYALNIENIDNIQEVDHINASSDEFFYKIYFQDDLLSIAAGKAGVKFYLDINSKFLDLNSYSSSPDIYPTTPGTNYVYDIYPDFFYFYTPFSGSSIKIVHYGKNSAYQAQSGDIFSLLTNNDSILDFTINYDNIYVSTFKDSIKSWNLNSDLNQPTPNLIDEKNWGYGYGDFKKVLSSKDKLVAFSFLFYNYHYVKAPKIVLFSLANGSNEALSSISFADSVVDFDFNDSLLFAGNRDFINIYSISDLSNPSLISKISISNNFRSLDLVGSKLFGADSLSLYYYDVSDENNILHLDSLSTNFEIKKVRSNGNLVFVLSKNGIIYSAEVLSDTDTLDSLSVFVDGGVSDFDLKGSYIFYLQNDTLKGKSYSTGSEEIFDSDLVSPFGLYSSDLYLILCQNSNNTKIYEIGENYAALKKTIDPYDAIQYGCYNSDSAKIILSEGTALRFILADTSNINHKPVFTVTLPDTSIIAFDTLIYKLQAMDPDGDNVDISFDGASPEHSSLNNDTLVFIPDNSQVGDVQFIFKASDGRGGVARDTAIVTVVEYKPSPSPFSLISPPQDSILNSSNFTFVWESPVPDTATFFRLIWGDGTTFDTIDNIVDTSYSISASLTENKRYLWKVIAYNTDTLYATENTEGFVPFYFNQTEEAPNQVMLIYPASGSTISEKQPTFKFLRATDPDPLDTNFVYYFYLSEKSDFSTILIEDSIVVDTFSTDTLFYTISKYLLDNRTYYWKVRAKDRAGLLSDFSIYSFMVNLDNDPPEAFNLLTPANDSIFSGQNSVEITWENATDPENDPVHYRLLVAEDSLFNNIILDSLLNSTNFTFTTPYFTDNTIFYWEVYAIDDKDATRLSRQIYRFIRNDFNDAPAKPELYTPANEIVSTLTPTLILTNSTDPDPLDTVYYVFYVYSDKNGANLVDSSDKVMEKSFGQTFYKTRELEDNKQYYWGARAFDKSGAYSERTSLLSFFVDLGNSNPEDFTLIEPENGSEFEDKTPTFKWHSTTDPDPNDTIVYYQLLIDTTFQFINPVFNMVDLTDTVFTVPVELDTGLYYWKVIAYDKHEGTRQTSVWTFRIKPGELPPSAPSIISPINDTIVKEENFPIIIKNSVDPNPEDRITYDLYISKKPDVITGDPDIYQIIADRSKNQTIYNFPGKLDDNYRYYMLIRAYDGSLYSDYSPVYSFYLNYKEENPSKFKLLNPSNDTVLSYMSLISWKKSIDPDPLDSVTYDIKIIFENIVFKEIKNLSDTFYIFKDTAGFIDNNDYSIFVTAIDKNNNITSSDTISVVFDNNGSIPPGKFSLLYPENNAKEVPTNNLQFSWTKAKTYSSGQVILYKFILLNSDNDSIFSKLIQDTTLALDNGLLEFDNTYLWGVIAYSYSGNNIDSTFSEPILAQFSTQSIPPGPITNFHYFVEDNSLNFVWSGNPVQPFSKVIASTSIYGNELYDTLDYPQDTVYEFPFKNLGSTNYTFKFNSYNSNNIKSNSPDIVVSIADDISLPVISVPALNSFISGNFISFLFNSLDGNPNSVNCTIKVDDILCGYITNVPCWKTYPLLNKKDGDTIKVEIMDKITNRKNEFYYIYSSSNGVNFLSNENVKISLDKGKGASFIIFSDTNYFYLMDIGPVKGDSLNVLTTTMKAAEFPFDTLNYRMIGYENKYLNFIFLTSGTEDSIRVFLFNKNDQSKMAKAVTENGYKVFFEDISKNLDTLEILYDSIKEMYYVNVTQNGSLYWTRSVKTDIDESDMINNDRKVIAKVYPNPAHDFIKFDILNYNGSYELRIFDLNGKIILKKKDLDKDFYLRVDRNFSSGIYFYVIKGRDFTLTGRFIVIK